MYAEDVNVHAKLGVDELARARDALGVALANVAAFEFLEVLLAHHQIHIGGHAPMTILIEREGADDGVRKVLGLEDRG